MMVRVQLFARARELVRAAILELSLPEGATVGCLRERLAVEYPVLDALLERSAIAMNEEFADDSVVVQPGANLAVLPPVSGGA